MSYATLMVYVDADDAPEQRVRLAASFADKFTATLIGFSALKPRPPIGAEGAVIAQVTEADIAEIRAKLSDIGNWFHKIAGAEHPKLEWRSTLGYPTEELAREARSADLIVIGRSKESGDIYSSLDAGLDAATGESLQALIAETMNTPREVVDRVKRVISTK